MASFFKLKCMIYWIAFVICLGICFGVKIFDSKFTIHDSTYTRLSLITDTVCFYLIYSSLVGCIFVKCNINHICCFLFFIFPLIFLVPPLCIYGVSIVRRFPGFKNESLLVIVKSYMEENGGELPEWFQNTQKNYLCCGINSFQDYRMYFYKDSYTVEDVPRICCVSDETQKSSKVNSLQGMTKNYTVPCNRGLLYTPNITGSWQINSTINSSGSPEGSSAILPLLLTPGEKKLYFGDERKAQKWFLRERNRTNLEARIYIDGCGRQIEDNTFTIYQTHFVFFFVLIAFSLAMAGIYIRNWCQSKHFIKGNSDHSLDILVHQAQVELPQLVMNSSNAMLHVLEEKVKKAKARGSIVSGTGSEMYNPIKKPIAKPPTIKKIDY